MLQAQTRELSLWLGQKSEPSEASKYPCLNTAAQFSLVNGLLCELLVAEYAGKALAALFVAPNGDRAYYLYGASTAAERHRMPTYLLQWGVMKWAKSAWIRRRRSL